MKIIKIVIGTLLILLSIFLSLAAILSIFNSIVRIINELKISTASGIGYAIGSFAILAIFISIIYLLFKFGWKLINNKNTNSQNNPINEIGSGL